MDAGGSSIERPGPAKGIIGGGLILLPLRSTAGVALLLRPLVGLGATMTSMGGVIGFDFDLSLFVGLGSAGGAVVVSAAALDELDDAPGVREALLLLALAFAVATISGTDCLPIIAPFIGRPFPVDFGATISGTGAGSSFGADFAFFSRWAFRLVSSDALIFAWSGFANLPLFS